MDTQSFIKDIFHEDKHTYTLQQQAASQSGGGPYYLHSIRCSTIDPDGIIEHNKAFTHQLGLCL